MLTTARTPDNSIIHTLGKLWHLLFPPCPRARSRARRRGTWPLIRIGKRPWHTDIWEI